MLIRCGEQEAKTVFAYIGADYARCLYLYLDLKQYGFASDTTELYIQRDGISVRAVLLKYYSCVHIYSRDDRFDADELCRYILQSACTIVYCTESTARLLYPKLYGVLGEKASFSTGWVARIEAVDKPPKGLAVPAERRDFAQIVKLIYDDEDIGRSYRCDELAKQLRERSAQGYTRNLVIKQGDLVVAHACTNAEWDDIAVTAELIVLDRYRRRGYGAEIWRDLCGRLLAEGKEVYSFYFSEQSRALHQKIGFFEVCNWSKIVIERD